MKIETVKMLVAKLHDKTEYVIHITSLKQALSHGLFSRKVHRVKTIYLYEHSSKKKAKNDFVKNFFNLINIAVFGEMIKNVRKHRDIKLVTIKRGRNYLL